MTVQITPLQPGDRAEWRTLFEAYITFYESELPEATYDATWLRLMDPASAIGGFAARLHGGPIVGFTHYYPHPSTWTTADSCYLHDLFTLPAARGQGVAQALIEAVAAEARRIGCGRLYWLTHETNATARRLYDRIAQHLGFLEYEYPL
jgi:GNAT superfamily N-acetyltransferase